jgi:hypothetical protein
MLFEYPEAKHVDKIVYKKKESICVEARSAESAEVIYKAARSQLFVRNRIRREAYEKTMDVTITWKEGSKQVILTGDLEGAVDLLHAYDILSEAQYINLSSTVYVKEGDFFAVPDDSQMTPPFVAPLRKPESPSIVGSKLAMWQPTSKDIQPSSENTKNMHSMQDDAKKNPEVVRFHPAPGMVR